MKSLRASLAATLTTAAAAVLVAAPPAAADPALAVSGISFSTGHVDVREAPAQVELRFTVTGADPAASEIHGSIWYAQYAGDRQIGPTEFAPYDNVDPRTGAARLSVHVPQYGATRHAEWRLLKLTATDATSGAATVEGPALAGVEVGVTQRVDSARPTHHVTTLWFGQSSRVVDPGTGVTLEYAVTVSDLQAGFWTGRLTLTGPDGRRARSAFTVASDGRHLTCGAASLVDDFFDHVLCHVPVDIAAGAPAGAWSVARVTLTDRAGNTTVVRRPAAPVVTVVRP